jgi:hypothetical protein
MEGFLDRPLDISSLKVLGGNPNILAIALFDSFSSVAALRL